MIKNNLIYGFNENGVIGYTKNAIGDMSVLVHEYAHTYFNNNETIRQTLVLGVYAREFPGGLLKLDPAFAYAEPPSS